MLMGDNEFKIRPAVNSDRSRIANLIHFGSYVHQHLDWMSPVDWIGRQPYLVIEKGDLVLAALACPPDIPEITWIRLFAVSSTIGKDEAWRLLWNTILEELSKKGKIKVSALSMQSWFSEILTSSNFRQIDAVIVLLNEEFSLLKEPCQPSIKIRLMTPEDLPDVMDIDNSAFGLEWRNSKETLERAFQQSSYTTIAEKGDEIVGYQCSTSSGMGAHLARLAINLPEQGKGIGYLLVYDMLKHFRAQGVINISVNTQESNFASLALYDKAGFTTCGESYQVFQYTL